MVKTEMQPSGQRLKQGFSLLEALIALVIVSIALGVLFQVVSGSHRLGRRAMETFELRSHAQALFLEALPVDAEWQDLTWHGEDGAFEWVLEVHPVALRESLKAFDLVSGYNLLRFEFRCTDSRTVRLVHLSSYRNVEEEFLPFVLEKAGASVLWDEHDRLLGELRQ